MTQPHLFETSPTDDTAGRRSRRTDPATSHAGATHIESSAGCLQRLFLDALRHQFPMTANEVARACSERHQVMPESVRKRAKELQRTGAITVVGERRCRVTGRQAQTYALPTQEPAK